MNYIVYPSSNGEYVRVSIPIDMYNKLVYIGILPSNNDKEENIREYNVGESNYAKHDHILQPWTIWLDYDNLTSFDHDIIKRILREKEEPGFTKVESRIKDYNKIIHICKERIRQLNCEYEYNKINK